MLDDPETSRKLILDTNQPEVRVLLVRATGKEIATAGKLIEESQAATFLRRNH